MPTTSRYILELNGAPSVSSTNNSVVNIPGIAGTGSNVAIDLDTLGTTVGGTPVQYLSGCLLSNVSAYQGTTLVTDQASCAAAANLIQQNACSTDISCLYNGPNNLTGTPTIPSVTDAYASGSCSILLANPNVNSSGNGYCNNLSDYIFNNNNPYAGLAHNSCGNNCSAQLNDYLLNDNGSVSRNTNIIYSSIADGLMTIPGTPGTTQGITFTCGTDSSINYSYNNFDVTLQNSCANHDQSFLLFTPQASATGDQSLGGSTNTDNSINLPFHINNIQSQNGDFYIEPFCDTDGMGRDILVSVLDNTILV